MNKEKDYIENPKPNGYRSLHLIVSIPIFLSHEKKYRKVEVQFRTIVRQLKVCADSIGILDYQMQEIRNQIDKHDEQGRKNN